MQWTKSWTVSWWFSKTSSTACAVFTYLICQTQRSSLHDGCQPTLELFSPSPYKNVVSVHHHQTPALNGSEFQGWKCSACINCHTTIFSAWQCFHNHYHCK
jgi:hypothetical protein